MLSDTSQRRERHSNPFSRVSNGNDQNHDHEPALATFFLPFWRELVLMIGTALLMGIALI